MKPLFRILFANLVVAVGCSKAAPVAKAPPAVAKEAAEITPAKPPVLDDDTLAKKVVNEWLADQENGGTGAAFWDDYARTSVSAPNLSGYAQLSIETNRADRKLAELDGRRSPPLLTTVFAVESLNAVRSWKMLTAKITPYNEKQTAWHDREAFCQVKVRVDSSKLDGTNITQIWTIELLKNKGKWGISGAYDK